MRSIKTIKKFLCEEYGLDYDEAILKIYNDPNERCFNVIRQEKIERCRELRYELEEVDEESKECSKNEIKEKVSEVLCSVNLEEYFEKVSDKEYKCLRCEKMYKNLGKCARKHIESCC